MKRRRKIAAVISFIVLVAALLFVFFQLFRVRSIIVEGGASAEQIKSICGIEKGDMTFFVDKQLAYDRIEAEPWLKAVSVTVIYPDKVKIEAEQRQIAAFVKKDDIFIAIDKECMVLSAEQSVNTDLPVITGLKMDVFEVGKQLGCPDKFMLGVLNRLFEELKKSSLDITEINASYAASLEIKTKEGMIIELGDDTNLSGKLKLAEATIEELADRGSTSGILNVSSPLSAYYR